jgi:hypothetical protein
MRKYKNNIESTINFGEEFICNAVKLLEGSQGIVLLSESLVIDSKSLWIIEKNRNVLIRYEKFSRVTEFFVLIIEFRFLMTSNVSQRRQRFYRLPFYLSRTEPLRLYLVLSLLHNLYHQHQLQLKDYSPQNYKDSN